MASAVIDVTSETKQVASISSQDYDVSENSVDNSLVQSPSIDSFSTFQETENLSELNMDENVDLCIKIDNPQKHLDTLETYVTFRITTKVARIEFAENEYIVRRRYNDFMWLRARLVDCHPTHIIPPLPAKHTLMGQLDRYSKDFIVARMRLLNFFMSRVANHPILSCNDFFKTFLTAKQTEFAACRKLRRPPAAHHGPAGLPAKHRTSEFDKTRDYLNTLSEKLVMIDKISMRIAKERSDYVSELNGVYPVFQSWACAEAELSPVLRSMAAAVERTSAAQADAVQQTGTTISGPLREFLMYVECVKDVLHKRDCFHATYEHSLDELNKKRLEKENLVSFNQPQPAHFSLWKSQTVDDKLERLGVQIPALVKQTETDQDRLECANEAVRSDVSRWHSEKQACLKKILLDFATKQIDLYERAVGAWEKVVVQCNGDAPAK